MAKAVEVEKRLSRLISLPSEKKVYFNGMVVSMSASDVMIGLETNGEPAILLNTSFSVAKALVQLLGVTIDKFEKDTEYEIPTLKEVEEKLGKAKENAKAK